jgi:hypothetical protein
LAPLKKVNKIIIPKKNWKEILIFITQKHLVIVKYGKLWELVILRKCSIKFVDLFSGALFSK